MNLQSLDKLFIHELKDLYSAENQLLKALPQMAKAASSDELRQGFEHHLHLTKDHVKRIEQILQDREVCPSGDKCAAMEGLIHEGEEIIEMNGDAAVKDAALIGAAQRVEHYEIAGYGTARNFAQHLGNDKAAKLLQQTLDEEGQTDQKLTKLAEGGAHITEMALRSSAPEPTPILVYIHPFSMDCAGGLPGAVQFNPASPGTPHYPRNSGQIPRMTRSASWRMTLPAA
jgi:ferritin-like metal-binding protein YciE